MDNFKKLMMGMAFRTKAMKDGGLLYSFAPGHGRCVGYRLNERSSKRVMVFAVAEEPMPNGTTTGLLDEEMLNVFGVVVDTPGAAESIAKAFSLMAEEMRRSNEADRR